MTNNEIFRRLRYLFDYKEEDIVALFALTNVEVEKDRVSKWLMAEDDFFYEELLDLDLSSFLNGVIMEQRGKQAGETPVPELVLNNNIIFRKLRIALNLRSEDIINIFASINRIISPHELSAFFRDPQHSKYRICKDQYLRNFLNGLQFQKKSLLKLNNKV